MKLPKIYEHFRQGQIFTIEEARDRLQTTGNTLRKRLSELASRGYLAPIRQGLYRVSSPSDICERHKSSPFAVAAKLTPSCYVAFSSALQLHAGETPHERDTVFVVSPTKFNAFAFEGRHYFWCQSPDDFGTEELLLQRDHLTFTVRASNFEKSIVDCLRRTAHSPSLPELMRLSKAVDRVPDFELILNYAAQCKVAALLNRVGFFFETMQSHWEVPEEFLAEIEKTMSRKQTEWPIALTAQVRGSGATAAEPASAPRTHLGSKARWRIQFGAHLKDNAVAELNAILEMQAKEIQDHGKENQDDGADALPLLS